jgi:hypothetical protein
MGSIIFDNSSLAGDAPYLQWLHDHPDGLVLTTRRRFDPTYMVLHRATCRSISKATGQMGENPFTGRGYIKVCSGSPDALLVWIVQQGGMGFTKRCSLCAV